MVILLTFKLPVSSWNELKLWKTLLMASSVRYLPLIFFFSSRRRHTRYIGDWSSDVCSSDLTARLQVAAMILGEGVVTALIGAALGIGVGFFLAALVTHALASEGIVFAVPWVQIDRKSVV